MSEAATHVFELRIAADHPSLPGHFPGHPLVPGVVLLDSVIAGAERWLGRPLRIDTLVQAKFTRPLLPEQTAIVTLALASETLRFEITSGEARLAQGVFALRSEAHQ